MAYIPIHVLYHTSNEKRLFSASNMSFTTRPPAVPDVLGSGRNVGALRPGRRVGFRLLIADDIFW